MLKFSLRVAAGPVLVELAVVLPVDDFAVRERVVRVCEADAKVGHLLLRGLRIVKNDLAGEAAELIRAWIARRDGPFVGPLVRFVGGFGESVGPHRVRCGARVAIKQEWPDALGPLLALGDDQLGAAVVGPSRHKAAWAERGR